MTRVKRYALGDKGKRVELSVPTDSKWISASIQLEMITLYALDSDSTKKKLRKAVIRVAATDTDLDAGLPPGKFNSFLFTVTQGPLVWHLFEELEI